jgi:hypothetical protein
MNLTDLQITLRRNIIEHLRLLSSAEEQLQYQRNVPSVNIIVELVCGWFDEDYMPEDEAFSSAFSMRELQAMSEFNRVFDDIVVSTLRDEEMPQIEDFIKTPEWTGLSQAASLTLSAFPTASISAES